MTWWKWSESIESQALPPSNPRVENGRTWTSVEIWVCPKGTLKNRNGKTNTSISGAWSCSNYQTCYFKWGIPDIPYSTHILWYFRIMLQFFAMKKIHWSPWNVGKKNTSEKELFLYVVMIFNDPSRYPIDPMRIFQRTTNLRISGDYGRIYPMKNVLFINLFSIPVLRNHFQYPMKYHDSPLWTMICAIKSREISVKSKSSHDFPMMFIIFPLNPIKSPMNFLPWFPNEIAQITSMIVLGGLVNVPTCPNPIGDWFHITLKSLLEMISPIVKWRLIGTLTNPWSMMKSVDLHPRLHPTIRDHRETHHSIDYG